MKKGIELLQTLSPETQEKFRNNVESTLFFNHLKRSNYINMEYFILAAFAWKLTPEGHDFWKAVSEGVKK